MTAPITPTVFKTFEADDVVTANPTEVSTGLFSGDTGSLTAFYTSSTQVAQTNGQYYYDVYNINPSSSTAEVQFSVAYGHVLGGGGPTVFQDQNATLATQATYFQYRNMLLDPLDPYFTVAGNRNLNHIWVVNFRRQRLREKLDPGNWMLTLSGSSGSFTFIDDSLQTLSPSAGRGGRVFNIASGSINGVSGSVIFASSSATQGGYGLCYPDVGLLILNPDALVQIGAVVTAPQTGSSATFQFNQQYLLNSIARGALFDARSAENITSTHFFVRLRNKEFNYSNNPSFFDETTGNLIENDFINDPRVYVTTIGLLNDSNELLAVGKLSKPTQKGFDKELLIRVRLDF